ncbi:MAPEG family protein [Bradyrhizobium manausense]|uniref:MAPEG family protein n=1 Tax=Bradyrhizobium manausense TaxID=989370 RepID=UPI001BAB1ED0|nr:MAPEG family protein [Bradyrhizobium manausense]MBR0690538.1 MAPEG family protein [Bradyrhizobium manausense]MBR0722091.1 MAPEG family protein [Bradyrhizobium manausense]
MHVPTITANYLAVLALIYAALALQVVRLRRSSGAPFDDGGDASLRSAIRAHGNFMEYVPIIALMVAMLEMSGASPLRIHLLMGALVLSRLLHPLGMYAVPGSLKFTICRAGSIFLTVGLLVYSALTILSRLPWAAFADEVSDQAIATIEFLQVIHIILTL